MSCIVMQNFTLQSTVGHRIQDHLEQQAVFEPFSLRTCNTLGLSGMNMNRVSRIRERGNGHQAPGTNIESGSAEYRQSPRHVLSYTPITSRNATRIQSRRKASQDHLIPLVERSDSESSTFDSMSGNIAVNSWTAGPDPLTAYNLHYQLHQPFTPNRLQQRYFGSVQELAGVGETVGDYLARTRNSSPSLYLSSPEEFCGNSGSDLDRRISTTSSSFDDMFGISPPLTPKSETLTMGSTLPSDMSRQSSCIEGMGMMRLNSSVSDFNPATFGPHGDTSITLSGTPNEEQSLWLAGAGGAGCYLPNQLSDISSETVGPIEVTDFIIEDMRRSQSNDSNASGSPTSSRSKQQLKRQIQLAAARPIAPKQEDELAISRQGSVSSITTTNQSNNAVHDRQVTAIPKMPYQRPKHERVYCKKCDEHPDGFRGEHELRRHQDRQHKLVVKKWICVEPSKHSQADSPITPLSKCKACQQRKRYGAYYNAAAHLRRSHFRPKPKSRTKGGRAEDKLQKRGGKGGGDWPPMAQLKNWMEEVAEIATDNQTADADGDDDGETESEALLPINNAAINFHLAPDFDPVFMQHKSNLGPEDLSTVPMQLDFQDGSISSMHKSASSQVNFGMQHMAVKGLDATSVYGPRVLMGTSPYMNTSYDEDFGDLRNMEFDDLPIHFM